MTQENKQLLLKDLCSRLPYGVKISIPELWISEKKIEVLNEIFKGDDGLYRVNDSGMLIEHVKPYLFPLSSMTEGQANDLFNTFGINQFDGDDYIKINECTGITFFLNRGFDVETHLYNLINWLYKNHFDIYGLIPMGLAKDATGLNIY